MQIVKWGILILAATLVAFIFYSSLSSSDDVEQVQVLVAEESYSQQEPGFEPEPAPAELMDMPVGAPQKYTTEELRQWERAPGPLRVGLQVGHLNNQTMPEELENLERNTGAVWGNLTEADVNIRIVELVAERLRAEGIEVDILEAAVPPGYQADLFASVHADGNPNSAINGYKFAAPRRDYAGTSHAIVDALYESYGVATGLREDLSVTRRMTAYYAFNWPRYEYAIHPYTPAVIIEAGFLTSPVDRAIVVNQPERAAAGIATGIINFLTDESVERRPLPTQFVDAVLPLTGEVVCAPLRAERLARMTEPVPCEPALADQQGNLFLLPNYSSTTISIGSNFTATGEYIPIQSVPQYFWFPYEVSGIILEPEREIPDSWYLRLQRR